MHKKNKVNRIAARSSKKKNSDASIGAWVGIFKWFHVGFTNIEISSVWFEYMESQNIRFRLVVLVIFLKSPALHHRCIVQPLENNTATEFLFDKLHT